MWGRLGCVGWVSVCHLQPGYPKAWWRDVVWSLVFSLLPPPTARAFCLGPASYGACLDPQRALPSVLGQQDSAQTKLQALLSVMVTLQNLLLCSSISSIRL